MSVASEAFAKGDHEYRVGSLTVRGRDQSSCANKYVRFMRPMKDFKVELIENGIEVDYWIFNMDGHIKNEREVD